jgi:hypothetical protein
MDFLTPTVDSQFQGDAAPAVDTKADRRKTRWGVFCGDDMSDVFKRQFSGAKIGGLYLGHDYKTLHMTKHLMRRCEITPFVIGYDYLNTDSLGGDTSKTVSFSEWNDQTRRMETRYAYECLPADELEGLLSALQGPFDIGVREIESLFGVDEPKAIKNTEGRITGYTPSKGTQMQRLIFPDWDRYVSGELEFFPTIDGLRQYLLTRRDQVDEDVQEVVDVLIESNEQFGRWAADRLSEKGVLVKSPVSPEGRVYSWDRTDFRRFNQTGIDREDMLQTAKPEPVNDGVTREELLQMFAPLAKFMEHQAAKEGSSTDLTPETPVSVDGKPGRIVEKKGGGYYNVLFDDGTEGNFRPAQFD